MSLVEYGELEQGTEAWLEARRGIVTASVVGKLITARTLKVASNDESRGLTAQLVAERITGWSDPTYFNGDMQRGHDIEPIARDWYAERNGVKVDEIGFMVRDDWGFKIGYSPDGMVGTDGLIEVKAPRAKTHLTTHLSGEVPAYHMAQIQCGLLVADRCYCDFISFYAGMPPFVKRVERIERWGDLIVEAVENFEFTAKEMQAEYATATTGMPNTERLLIDMEMVI
jgi:putative phage-type endonuclease